MPKGTYDGLVSERRKQVWRSSPAGSASLVVDRVHIATKA